MTMPTADLSPVTPMPARSDDRQRVAVRWVSAVAVTALLVWWSPLLVGVIVLLLMLIVAHEAGHYCAARSTGMKAPEFMVGFGPALLKYRRGETTWGLRAIPLGGYVRISGMSAAEVVDAADEHRTYRSKRAWQRVFVSAAGPAANILCAIVLLVVAYAGFGRPVETLVVEEVRDGTPAAAAGLREGDVLAAIDGQEISTMDQWRDVLAASSGEVAVAVERRGTRVIEPVTPVQLDGRRVIGVVATSVDERLSVTEAVTQGSVDTIETLGAAFVAVGKTFATVGDQLASAVTGQPSEQRVVSAVGVARAAEGQNLEAVWLLQIAALINISLAAFNLFPVPPLDGGHMCVAVIEGAASKVRRTQVRVSARVLQPVAFVMWGVLMLVGLSAIWLDLTVPLSP
jgi:regulator of sigma E protease